MEMQPVGSPAGWQSNAEQRDVDVQALDVIQAMCTARGWSSVRIDGGTATDQRQDVVTNFNLYSVGQAGLSCGCLVRCLHMDTASRDWAMVCAAAGHSACYFQPCG